LPDLPADVRLGVQPGAGYPGLAGDSGEGDGGADAVEFPDRLDRPGAVPLENRIRSGDLQVFHASGSVRVFVDQAVENRFSADLLCADIGHGGAGSGTFAVGDALGDPLVGPSRV
jgi:hypothetical protein